MSAEDRAAQPLSPDLFDAILRTVREAVRAEIRAEFDGRKLSPDREMAMLQTVAIAREADLRGRSYSVPQSLAGVPV
jgi:hypothetical protein